MTAAIEPLQISHEQLRSLVVETLGTLTSGQIGNLNNAVARTAVKHGLVRDPRPQGVIGIDDTRLARIDAARVQDIFWDLLVEGIIRPGLDPSNPDFPFFHVTAYGQQVLQHGQQSPYDPDGYLRRLHTDIPNLDAVILTYLTESLHTFRIGCLLSSTITLGCASEKAFLSLIDAYAAALPEAQREKFRKETEGRMIKRQFDEFIKRLESHLKPKLTGDLRDDLDVTLSGVFAMMRNLRNDTGHPTGTVVPREVAYANLTVFPTYLRKIYALIAWLPTAAL